MRNVIFVWGIARRVFEAEGKSQILLVSLYCQVSVIHSYIRLFHLQFFINHTIDHLEKLFRLYAGQSMQLKDSTVEQMMQFRKPLVRTSRRSPEQQQPKKSNRQKNRSQGL